MSSGDQTVMGTKRLLPGQRASRTQASSASLLIYRRDGMTSHPLCEGQSLSIGRQAEIVIDDESLSREHARISVQEGIVWVEDLGSTNGTWVNGEVVTRQQVGAGDEILLGAVCASIHTLSAGPITEGLETHESFLRLLDYEFRRTRGLGGELSLLMVGHTGNAPLGRWFRKLAALLRPVDVAGAYSPQIIELLLPQTDDAAALRRAQQISAALGSPYHCGAAGFPSASWSSEELLAVGLQTLRDCDATKPYRLAAAQHSLQVGGKNDEQPIILAPAMRELYRIVSQVARSTIPVLIHGETGAGKELIARALHQKSARSDQKLGSLNCGAIAEHLVQSALFGHEKGAFTGADQQRLGVFEQANKGTVFLDEIGELSAAAQVALLRVLETQKLTRVGGSEEVAIDVRIIAATHRDLEQMCQAGEFRLDLFYRLNAMVLELPPLRARGEELEALTSHFLVLANRQNGRQIGGFDRPALEAMRRHSWPGNVRELRNVIERAVVIAQGNAITLDDLPPSIRRLGDARSAGAPANQAQGSSAGDPDEEALASTFDEELDFKTRVQRFESQLIERAFRACDGNQSETSRRLRIPLRTLITKLRQFQIK